VLEGLKAEIAAVAARDLSVGAAGLGPEVLELRQVSGMPFAQYTRFLAAFDRAEGYADEQLTSAAWLRAQTTLSHGQAAANSRISRLREKLPKLTAVYDAGEASFAHLQAALAGMRELPDELWSEVDAALAVTARTMTAKELGGWLRELAQGLAPTPKPRDETRYELRRLSLSTGFDGMTTLTGRLTPEVGEKLQAALSAASRPDTDDEVRLPNQRKADALDAVLDTVLDTAALPIEGGEKPHIVLNVDLDKLAEAAQQAEEEAAASAAQPFGDPAERVAQAAAAATAAADATSGLPRFAWTGPADVATGRRLSCDGLVLPVFTRGDQPIDVGRSTRVISSALRAFIVARDQTCRWPACTMPPRWSQCHHLEHWRDGGRTDRDNLILICERHHRAAHNGQFVVTQHQPGVISVRRRKPGDPLYEVRAPAPPEPEPELAFA
jgi:hypothetical protein